MSRSRNRFLSLFVGILFAFIIGHFVSTKSVDQVSYLEQVQPILATKCYACHGPDSSKREADLRLDIRSGLFESLESGHAAIDSIHPDLSEILRRIESDDPDEVMPPPEFPKTLNLDEIQTLKTWINQGAPWEEHWSQKPLQSVSVPFSNKRRWQKNPIDAFVFKKWQEQKLEPNPKADRRILIRRLYFDLHGLPPSPEAVDAFVKSETPDAYQDLIDKLLESPRYGERWARHWLDVVHYGETHGYDKDQRRLNAWPYRDYVIKSLNEDKPYGIFVQEQIAGDILFPEDPDAICALGFLVTGPWDLVGHVELREGTVDKRIARNLDRDDIVTNVMTTFNSLTVHCARCHDHKFDPIRQVDYYGLQAVFAGIDRAERPYDVDLDLHRQRTYLRGQSKMCEQDLKKLSQSLPSAEQSTLQKNLDEQDKLRIKIRQLKRPASSNFGYHSRTADHPNELKWFQIDLGDEFAIDKLVITPSHPTEGIPMPGYGFPLRFKVELISEVDRNLTQVLLDYSTEDHTLRTDRPMTVSVDSMKGRFVRFTANKLWKGRGETYFLALAELQVFSEGENVARNKMVQVKDASLQEKWSPRFVTDGANSRHWISGERLPKSLMYELNKYEAKYLALQRKEQDIRQKMLPRHLQTKLQNVASKFDLLRDSMARLPEPSYVFAAANEFNPWGNFTPPDSVRSIFILHRGDTEAPISLARPGAIKTWKFLPHLFPASEEEGDRRAALAHWITDPLNAYTWRSIINRIWQYHFGVGLVSTPNDFGKMGTSPSHPDLLDYLCQEFLAHGQSIKWLHRLILQSETYQLASSYNKSNHKRDGENKYLWRANRRQLEAEAIRDGVLAVSDKLDLKMGGPGFDPFVFEDDHSPRYLYKDYDPYDPSTFRRAIYRTVTRTVPDPMMTTLDCADPSHSVAVRNETITALQALSMLNHPFMVRQADFFAQRLQTSSSDLKGQIREAISLAFQREPSIEEEERLIQYAHNHGLPSTCRLIFAMNEFQYVD